MQERTFTASIPPNISTADSPRCCNSALVISLSIAPYSYYVASMLPKMISVGMPHNYLVKLILAVICTEEQSFARDMPQQHDTLLCRNMMQRMLHLFC